MYKIMLLAKEGKNAVDSFYQFLTTTDSLGNTIIYDASTLSELDTKVESMLNGNYAKKDFIIVTTKDYNIDADIYKAQ